MEQTFEPGGPICPRTRSARGQPRRAGVSVGPEYRRMARSLYRLLIARSDRSAHGRDRRPGICATRDRRSRAAIGSDFARTAAARWRSLRSRSKIFRSDGARADPPSPYDSSALEAQRSARDCLHLGDDSRTARRGAHARKRALQSRAHRARNCPLPEIRTFFSSA